MPPELVALTEGPSIMLDKPILLIGRHQECDIQIPSRKISRRHCCIAQVNDHLVVRDLCSTNGVRINGVRVAEGTLNAGDELTIGNHRYEVRWPGAVGQAGGQQAAAAQGVPHEAGPRAGVPAPPRSVPDLDSFEEPVALADSGGQAVGKGAPLPAPPEHPLRALIIPENLSILPGSADRKKEPPAVSPPASHNSGVQKV